MFAVCQAVTAHGKQAVQRGYASALYFAVGPIMHTAKCLPCARDVAHDKLALCRPLFAVSCLPCVTLGKHFAECKPAFAVCRGHTANRHSPVVCQRLAFVTFNRRLLPSRKVQAALCIKDVGHGKRAKCERISTMVNRD